MRHVLWKLTCLVLEVRRNANLTSTAVAIPERAIDRTDHRGPNCYGNYTRSVLKNFVPRCDSICVYLES